MRFSVRFSILLLAGFLAASPAGFAAQMGSGATAATLGAPMDPAKALDAMLSLYEGEMVSVVKAMPADKFNFAPSGPIFAPGQTPKYDGVRNFAKQVSHVTQANYFFYASVSGLKPEVDVKAIGAMTEKEQLVSALEASFAFAHRAIATITPANAFLTIKGADGMQTRATLAAFAVAHGFDHYGQLVEYLRMNGIVPPPSAK